MTSSPQTSETWWSHNWKWVVPVGCLVPIIFVMVTVLAAFSFIKSSGPYGLALDTARADCEVQAALGTPVTAGWSVAGSINVSGPSGHADLSFPLHGSRTSGTLYVTATRTAGRWRFDLLQVEAAGRAERIDLLAKSRQHCP